MVIRNRLFPYPVLCGETDDYAESCEFIISPHVKENEFEILLDYDFEIKCEPIENLIRKGMAQFVLHIECSSTSFRKALKSDVPHITNRLEKSKVNGELDLVAMIVAKMEISEYNSKELNPDYEGEQIKFKKGSILAYQNLPPIYVTKKTETLADSNQFFKVTKQGSIDENEIKPLSFNLNSEQIQILVDIKTYDSYIKFMSSQSIAMSLLVLPAVTYMITEAGENPESYARYQWFQRMEKYYHSLGKDFVEDVLRRDENPVVIAQEMLHNPVSRTYRELLTLGR